MLNDKAEYKYETLYNGPFEITECWSNVTITLQVGSIKIRYNIHSIKPYKF